MMSMPDDSIHESIDGIDLRDSMALAAYIEQLLMTEQQWILKEPLKNPIDCVQISA